MSTSYTGVRVVSVEPDLINEIYTNKSIPVSMLDGRISRFLNQNEYVVLKFDNPPNSQSAISKVKGDCLTLVPPDISAENLKPRNKEQRMALDALLDPEIKVVVLTGKAGTGKTLLALSATMKNISNRLYDGVILTRSMSWVGKHSLGALPGDVDDKFGPYLQNYLCNIECLLNGNANRTDDLIQQYKMDFVPLQLIRGASWANRMIIADEVQVLNHDEMVALGTRVGENSKIVIMGDLGQRDENIKRTDTGIHKFVNDEKVKASPLVASIDLIKCERSPVAELFANVFDR